MTNPERVEAVAWMRRWKFDGVEVGAIRKRADRPPGWHLLPVTEGRLLDSDIPLYTPAAVAALLRGMVPPKVNELLPEDQAYNAALADVRANIARWESEGNGNG